MLFNIYRFGLDAWLQIDSFISFRFPSLVSMQPPFYYFIFAIV